MSKKLKIIYISILSFLGVLVFTLFAFFSFGVGEVKADSGSSNNIVIGDKTLGSFSFKYGRVNGRYVDNEPTFGLDVSFDYDSSESNLMTKYVQHLADWWSFNITDQYFMYTFSVYRCNSAYNLSTQEVDAEMISSYRLVFATEKDYGRDFFHLFILKKDFHNTGATIESDYGIDENKIKQTFFPAQGYDFFSCAGYESIRDVATSGGYKCIKSVKTSQMGLPFNSENENGNIIFTLLGITPYKEYFIKFDYQYRYVYERWMFQLNYNEDVKGSCFIKPISVNGMFNNYIDRGLTLEYLFANEPEYYARAVDIVEHITYERIAVQYLEQIEGTPFARSRKVYFDNVPFKAGVLHKDDLYACLADVYDVSAGTLGAYVDGYVLDNGVYVLKYLASNWLRALTEDGKYLDFFMDINKSYYDFYNDYVVRGIISSSLYEYWVNENLYRKYPSLVGLGFNEIYGCWAFVVTPTTLSLNELLKTVFDIDTRYSGCFGVFSYDMTISKVAYDDLMEDYQYPALSTLWVNIWADVGVTNHSCTCYMLYTSNDAAHLGEGGQESAEDTNSAIGKGIQSYVGIYMDFFTSIFGSFGKIVGIVAFLGLAGFAVFFFVFREPNKNKNKGKKK